MASERMTGRKKRRRSNSDNGEVSSYMDDSDELTLKELQVLLKKRKKGKKDVAMESDLESDSIKRAINLEVEEKAKTQSLGVQDVMDTSVKHVLSRNKCSRLAKECLQAKAVEENSIWSTDSDEEVEESSSQSDPNAVYCICRQKRNKRFMICCDRCEEWFHGDCVAVTEAHGRMLERNGEDYICPSCASQEIQNTVARRTQNIKHLESRTESGSTREQTVQLVDVKKEQMNSGIEMTSGRGAVDILQPASGVTGLPRCIGPGCSKNALPDSVYCGRDCIVRHAAATMKSLEAVKEYRERPKTESKVRKRLLQQRGARSTTTESASKALEEKESFSKEEEGPLQELSTLTWPTDQDCSAAKPEKMVVSSTFCKLSGEDIGMAQDKAVPAAPQELCVITSKSPESAQRSVDSEEAVVGGVRIPAVGGRSSKKPRLLPSPNFTRGTCTMPRTLSLLPRFKEQCVQNSHTSSASLSVVRSPQVACPPAPSKPPNNQMRHNIHRSLKDILYRRVNDSDDLQITESDIGKLAVSIEKEIFNMFLDTDAKYKNKYRSVMFHLKDPKNKALFYRVVCGEVTPFRLVRLTSQELLCREVPQQMDVKQEELIQKMAPDVDAGSSPPVLDGDEQRDQTTSSDTTTKKGLVPDVLCSMLTDTTAEHRRHLFDLNCKICIGCVLPDEELELKKTKLSVSSTTQDMEPNEKQESFSCKTDSPSGEEDSVVHIGIQNPNIESANSMEQELIKPFIPTMTHVGSNYHPSVIVTQTITSIPSTTEPVSETKLCLHSVPVSSVSLPKSPLLKPASSPDIDSFSASKSSSSLAGISQDGETAVYLPKQPVLWKGFISMHTVTKFATKACLVSGFFDCLEENLPDTIQIGGRISPQTVWDYVRKLKASFSKELCLIRFYPSSEEEEAAYVSLFSYFNSRGRFGVMANSKPYVKDLYVIPLSAKDPVPCQLLPFHGPGLEVDHPHLLLGLVICQKKFSGVSQENENKKSKITTEDSDNSALQNLHTDIKQANAGLFHLHLPASTTSDFPFSACPSVSLTNSPVTPSMFSVLSSKAPSITNLKKESSPTSTNCAPLQLILNTLFGKKKLDSDNSKVSLVENVQPHALLFDPIVQKFGGVSNEECTDDDRPYDPEEECHLEMHHGMETATDTVKVFSASPLDVLAAADDVAYDPEDESVFKEFEGIAASIPDQTQTKTLSEYRITSKSNSSELVQQQRMLEELNKEIELQKRQVEEQEKVLRQQKAVIGLSMAHFSVSDALMSPPSKLLRSNQLLQSEEEMKHSDLSVITQRSDTKKSEDSLQVATNQRVIPECPKKDGIGVRDFAEEQFSGYCLWNSEFCVETATSEVSSIEHMENIKECIPSLGEEVNSEKELKIIREPKVDYDQTSTEGEIGINPDTTYPNSSSTIKANDNNTPFSEFPPPTCLYMVDSLIPPVENTVSDFENITSPVGASSVYHSYKTQLEGSQQQLDYFQGTICDSVTSPGTLPPFKQVGQRMPSQVLSDTVPPQSLREMSPHAGEFVECQWCLPKFNTTPSNINYSGPRGSHFSRIEQNFCDRDLPTSYFPSPRIVPYGHGLQRDPFDSQYDFNYFMQGVEQHEEQMLLHSNKGRQLSSQGFDTVTFHNQSEGWRNPLHQHFTRFDCCSGPRMFQEQEGLPPSQFSDSRKLQFHLQGQHVQKDGRRLRHSGPLLPTPPQGPIQIDNRRQRSEFCHQSCWLRSSELRSSSPQIDFEPQNNGYLLSRTEAGHREKRWIQCPKGWRKEHGGEHSKPWREDLQQDISAWRQRYWEREHTTRREADGERKEGDKKKEKVLRRVQEDRHSERDRHRKHKDNLKNQDRERDEDNRDRRHTLSRSRDRDDRKQKFWKMPDQR